MSSLPKNVTVIEVGPRDGLQNEKNEIPTDVKLAFISALQQAGIKEMELTSFVSPKWVPQMADAAQIVRKVEQSDRQIVLTPNARGIQSALEAGATSMAVFVGVSDTFNLKNIKRTTQESVDDLRPSIRQLKADGHFVRACISTAFHCPYEGFIDPKRTVDLCREFVGMGVDELSVADTDGMADPESSHALFSTLKKEFPNILLTAHFHDTRKLAIANIYACLQAGISRFDTSAGGLGGCPFAPGATGNVATEDVLHLLHSSGIATGMDLEGVCRAVDIIAPYLSHPVETGMYRLYKNKKERRM